MLFGYEYAEGKPLDLGIALSVNNMLIQVCRMTWLGEGERSDAHPGGGGAAVRPSSHVIL